MKKIAILLLAMFVAAGALAAQEGLYIGVEVGIEDFSAAGDTMGITPYVGYEIEIIDSLELYAELSLPMFFKPDFDLGIWLELGATFSIGNIYLGLAVPTLLYDGFFDYVGFDFTVGSEFDSGFGIDATLYNSLNPFDFFNYLDIYGYYGMKALSFGLCVRLPLYKDVFKSEGLTVTPDAAFNINKLKIYAELPISNIGGKGDIGVGLTVGVKYSF